jgi:hypothetical protein
VITKVDIRSAQGGSLALVLTDDASGIIVEDIGGLDPVKATLVTTSFAQQDGSQYLSAKRESRNITLKLGLEPDWTIDTVRGLRNRIYSVLMPKTPVELKFLMSDGLDVKILGRVETTTYEMFTQEPEINTSIMCFDPDFVDPDPVLMNGSTTSGSDSILIPYPGSVETGLVFKLLVNRTMSGFSLYHQASDGTLKSMDFAASLLAGDIVTISTVPGSKYAILTRGGLDSSILFGVSPESSWMELMPGPNSLRVYASGAAVPFTLQYLSRYGAL